MFCVILTAYNTLGFDQIDDEAFFVLVLARIVEPTSTTNAVRVIHDLGIEYGHRNTFTKCLVRCQDRNYRDTLATACFHHALTCEDVTLVQNRRHDTRILRRKKKTTYAKGGELAKNPA